MDQQDDEPRQARKRPRADFPQNSHTEPEFRVIDSPHNPAAEDCNPLKDSEKTSIHHDLSGGHGEQDTDSVSEVIDHEISGRPWKEGTKKHAYPSRLVNFLIKRKFVELKNLSASTNSGCEGESTTSSISDYENSGSASLDGKQNIDSVSTGYFDKNSAKSAHDSVSLGGKQNDYSSSTSFFYKNCSKSARKGPTSNADENSMKDGEIVGVSRKTVRETLVLFHNVLADLRRHSKAVTSDYAEAIRILQKEQKCVNTMKRIGHVSGIEIGEMFQSRAELYVIGLHRQQINGIDYMETEDGVPLAVSIVDSGRYDNCDMSPEIMSYSGQGGNPRVQSRTVVVDQKLERGNLAMKRSIKARNLVRVIRRYQLPKKSVDGVKYMFVYVGLYTVDKCKQERGEFDKLVYKFTLARKSQKVEIPQAFKDGYEYC